MDSDAITVAYVHQDEVASSWHHSIIELLAHDLERELRVMRGGWVAIHSGTDGLVESRNMAVNAFLTDKSSDWLFWTDTDMGFAADILERLLESADPVKRPVVAALCFSQRETQPDGMGGYRCAATPIIFDWAEIEGRMGFTVRWDYPASTLVRCAGTGSAATLIHRSVFERVESRYGRIWYDRAPNTSTGQLIGEDLSFCLRAGSLGIPIHVHTGVRATHMKNVWLSEENYLRERAGAIGAPPAREPVAVIVPVLGRPQNAEPFMASLRASTGLATVYAVADLEDRETADAWNAAGATVLNAVGGEGPGTFARKANIGFRESQQPWLFLTGDDVRFRAGWLDHAQAVAGDRAHVVGTNDLGNPRVMAGEHACHMLIRRSYVEELGASWDGPGVVAHEGYRHWFVDDEIVIASKQRGVWAMALGSVVEHMHPLWRKGEMDETYRLGQESAKRDQRLFEARCEANLRRTA